MGTPEKLTIDDVAKYCGCSRATVSRVMNHDKRVRPETAEAVEAAMEKLGYHPNSMARALSAGKTNTVAVVVPEKWQEQPYYIKLIDAIEDVADSRGYNIILKRRKYIDSVSELVNRKQVDGVIFRNMEETGKELALYGKMERMGLPFILIGKPVSTYPFIKVDNVGGARAVASYLAEEGYKKILFIKGPELHVDSIDRLAGLKIGLSEKGFNLDNLFLSDGDYSTESGYHAAKEYFAKNKADAVFAANDRMALGVLLYCRENGIKVPEELGIVGFDDNFFAEYLTPSLTTVKPPMYEIGIVAMESLIRMIENSERPNIRVILPAELIIRESCRAGMKPDKKT
ncbi:MAG: LacI family DNA-binding transcriptional regulator [Spirochaetales bacterium]|nr:LacI family DNA-binding transcriptional regulator [Spirochaetales bacterium]